jgi:hypothetical protein
MLSPTRGGTLLQAGDAGPWIQTAAYEKPLLRLSPSLFVIRWATVCPKRQGLAALGTERRSNCASSLHTDLPHYVVLAASPRGSVFGPFASEITQIRDVDIERVTERIPATGITTAETSVCCSTTPVCTRQSAQRRMPELPKSSPGYRPRPARCLRVSSAEAVATACLQTLTIAQTLLKACRDAVTLLYGLPLPSTFRLWRQPGAYDR